MPRRFTGAAVEVRGAVCSPTAATSDQPGIGTRRTYRGAPLAVGRPKGERGEEAAGKLGGLGGVGLLSGKGGNCRAHCCMQCSCRGVPILSVMQGDGSCP